MNSNKVILIILAFISASLYAPKVKNTSYILIITTILVGFAVTKDVIISICIGLILGNIYVSLNNIPSEENIEGFKSKSKKKRKKCKKKKKKKKKTFKNTNDDVINENFDSDTESYDTEEEFEIDTKGSFLENYRALTPKQVKGLNSDTKNLISTQKQLIETLKNMGPALKDGKQILDTFKGYFGSNQDLGKAAKNLKNLDL